MKNNINNTITIEPRTERVFKLKCDLKNTAAFLNKQDYDLVKIPNAIIQINEQGEFLTTVMNCNTIAKTLNLNNLSIEPISNIQEIFNFNTKHSPPSYNRNKEIKNQLRLNHLNDEEKELIENLCLSFEDIFYLEGDQLTFTNQIKHEINTTDENPIFTKSYRYPHVHKQEVKTQISKMLGQGIIQPSVSPWSSPVWVVPKKMDASGKQKWRIVIDYRKLNEKTIGDKYPLPNISDLLDQLGKCEYFTTLDLASGFHQIEIDKKDIPKTAFSVENGHYEFVRMPFGLRNAPATFQRVMDNIMSGIQNEKCLIYMDDVIIYSSTLNEHMNRLKEVFFRLRKYNLKIQPDKCEFLRKEVSYLGHIITEKGVKPNPDKVAAVQRFPVPKNQKEIKSFLGMAGYYRRFIPNFAKITKPLTKLLQKDIDFNFNSECMESFELLKKTLISSPILIYPNFEEEFVLTTDASAFALGSVLSQGPIGKDLPIAYASRTLCTTETKYSVIERELLAIIWSVHHFRPYLYGRRFKLVTDHRPLTWLFSIKDPGSRLARWRLKLEEYDYEIVYKPGKINCNADALSRIRLNHIKESILFNNKVIKEDENSQSSETNNITEEDVLREFQIFQRRHENESLIDYSKITYTNNQLLDRSHKNIIVFFQKDKVQKLHEEILDDLLETNTDISCEKINIINSSKVRNRDYYIIGLPFENDLAIEHLFKLLMLNKHEIDTSKQYHIENIIDMPILEIFSFIFADDDLKLTICQNIVTTPDEDQRPIIINQYHDGKANLHRGINETIRRIKEKYNWPNLTKDVETYIKSCDTCARTKAIRKNLSQPLVITETPKTAFERINIDILEIPSRNYLLTIRDELTKFTQAYPIESKSAKNVVNTLLIYFQHYGTPLRIHCDSGCEFNNQLLKDLCLLYDIKLTFSSVGHPQSNGSLERFHSTLLEMIRTHKTDNPNEHPLTIVPYAIICYNNSLNSTHGFTPYELIFGHTSSRPPETLYNQKDLITKYIRDLNNRISYYYKTARNRILENKEKAKERFDKKVTENRYNFELGQQVYLKESQIKNKLEDKFLGPFTIKEVFDNNCCIIENEQYSTKVNFDRLKPCFSRQNNN